MAYKILRIYSIPYIHVYSNFLDKQESKNLNYFELQKEFFKKKISYSDVLSRNMKKLGNQSYEIIENFDYLQKKWVQENISSKIDNFNNNEILENQIAKIEPDIIFFQNLPSINLKKLRKNFKFIKKIIVHCGFEIDKELFQDIDLLFVTPHLYEKFKNDFKNLYLINHYFDESILESLQKKEKKDFIIFYGKTGNTNNFHHQYRFYLLKKISERFDIKIFSDELGRKYYYDKIDKKNYKQKIFQFLNYFKNRKSKDMFLHEYFPEKCFYPVYGLDMYNLIYNSNLVLNSHTDVSTKFSANMRLFETTGVGSGIMTEHSNNIYQLFGRDEIVTYKDHDDCLSKIDYYKNNLDELKEIALKGQKRTLKDHSSFVRISTIDSIIKKKL